MKQRLCLMLALLVTFCFCGCTTQDTAGATVNFYYRTTPISYSSESGVISVETRTVKSNANEYSVLLEQYLNGARKTGCTSPFPAGTTLEGFDLHDESASVILSSHLSLLSGHELMIACICLARTVFDMTQVQTVNIRAEGSLLDGKNYLSINADSFDLWDIAAHPES